MAINRDEALGGLVKKYRELHGLSQTAVAELLSSDLGQAINQNIVSELEKGRRWSKRPELPAAYARVLRIPRHEVQEAMGLPDEGTERPPTFAELVEADPTLTRAAKDHLINQYGLLQAASSHERAHKHSSGSGAADGGDGRARHAG